MRTYISVYTIVTTNPELRTFNTGAGDFENRNRNVFLGVETNDLRRNISHLGREKSRETQNRTIFPLVNPMRDKREMCASLSARPLFTLRLKLIFISLLLELSISARPRKRSSSRHPFPRPLQPLPQSEEHKHPPKANSNQLLMRICRHRKG